MDVVTSTFLSEVVRGSPASAVGWSRIGCLGVMERTMTPDQARVRVGAILERLSKLGFAAPPHVPFSLRGGELRAGPHPDYGVHWTVFWEPSRLDLRRIDLEEFSVDAAAEQIARYAAPRYADVRRRLEDFLTALQAESLWPIEEHRIADAFLVGVDTLAVRRGAPGPGGEATFVIEYETDSEPQDVAPGQAAPQPSRVDFTHAQPAEVVRFVKERHRITAS